MTHTEKIKNGFNTDFIGTEYMIKTCFKDYTHVLDKEVQINYGDITDGKKYIDFKFDSYDNDNIIIELKQISGSSWLKELDDETYVMWVKCATGVFAWAKVKDIKEFAKSDFFYIRKSMNAFTNTTFKNFTIDECVQHIKGFKTINLSDKDFWKERPVELKESKINVLELYHNKSYSEVYRRPNLTVEAYECLTGEKVSELEIELCSL